MRVGDTWQITHQGALVAAIRRSPAVDPAHGPGAVSRNARIRFGDTPTPTAVRLHDIEVGDLAVYEQLLELG